LITKHTGVIFDLRMSAETLQAVIDRVLEIDDGVRYGAFLDHNRTVMVRGIRPGIRSMGVKKQHERMMLRSKLGLLLHESWESIYGTCR
jgi:hypothetical protein